MCEFNQVTKLPISGSGKSGVGWFKLKNAQVYHDHFYKADAEEGIVVDVLNNETGVGVHVSLELDNDSARQLARAILDTVEQLEAKRAETERRLAAKRA
jgi:hypothetical protein